MASFDQEKVKRQRTPITAVEVEERIVRCSASQSKIVNAALDLAVGRIPAVAWAVDAEWTAHLGLSGFAGGETLIFSFPMPEYDEFLVNLCRHHTLTLAVEGCIPATITVIGPRTTALPAALRARGLL